MNSKVTKDSKSSNLDQSSHSKKTLVDAIHSVASTSGVGHLVGIAEQTERKSMKDQISDLRQEITDLGLGHLINTNPGVGMQSELKQLLSILSEYKKEVKSEQETQAITEPQGKIVHQTTEPRRLFGPRRNSFALELASQAESMGIQTSPQPLTKSNSKRRLSTVIKSFASTSGVGHLVGIAEQSNRKPMAEQVQDLKQEIAHLGLSHLIQETHKTMSLSAEIKALKKILSDNGHDLATTPEEYPESPAQSPRLQAVDPVVLAPRRASFAKQLVSTAETIGIQTDASPPLTKSNSKRRLSTVIKSFASTSGVGHLVGIAEQSNRKPMAEQVQDLKQEIAHLGLSHLIQETHKTMSLSAEIKALTKILTDHQKSEMIEEGDSADSFDETPMPPKPTSGMVTKQSFKPFQDFDDQHQTNSSEIDDNDEALSMIQEENQKLKASVEEMSRLVQMQRDEILRIQTMNDENVELLALQSTLLQEQQDAHTVSRTQQQQQQGMNELARSKIVLELNEKFCEDLQRQLLESQQSHEELKEKYHQLTITLRELRQTTEKSLVRGQEVRDREEIPEKLTEELDECQSLLRQTQSRLEQSQNEKNDLSSQLHLISSQAEVVIEEMQKYLQEKAALEETIIHLQKDLKSQQSREETLKSSDAMKNSQIAELQSELSTSREMIVTLEVRSRELEEEKQRLEERLAATVSARSSDSETASLQSQLESVCLENETKKKEISQLLALVKESQSKNSELSSEKETQLLELNQQRELVSTLSTNAEVVIEEMQKYLQEKAALEETIIHLQKDLKSQQSREETLKSSDAMKNSQIAELQSELSTSREMIVTLEVRSRELEEEKQRLEEQLAATVSAQSSSDSETASLQSQLESVCLENETKKKEISQLLALVKESQSSLLSKETDLADKEEQLTRATEEIVELTSVKESQLLELEQQRELISNLSSRLELSEISLKQATCALTETNTTLQRQLSALESSYRESTSRVETLEAKLLEASLQEKKYLQEINELNELLNEQNQFLSDAAESLDLAEEDIDEFEQELLQSQGEIKRLKTLLEERNEEKSSFLIKQKYLEKQILKLQKENTSLGTQLQLQLEEQRFHFQSRSGSLGNFQEFSDLSSSSNHLIGKTFSSSSSTAATSTSHSNHGGGGGGGGFLAKLYSGQTKNSIPLSAYVLLQKDNQKLLQRLSFQNHQLNDLTKILEITFAHKQKYSQRLPKNTSGSTSGSTSGPPHVSKSALIGTAGLASGNNSLETQDREDSSGNVSSAAEVDAESAWLEMNQVPVFSGYSFLCNRYGNEEDGNLFTKTHRHRSITTSAATGSGAGTGASDDSSQSFSIELQSTTLPLSPNEEYLRESIRRMRIGWTLIKINGSDRRDVIVHLDIQEKLLKFLSLRMDKDFQSHLTDTEIFITSISTILKTDEKGNPSHDNSCLSLVCKSEDILILKFVAAEERDIFYDGFLCTLCHIDPSFRQHQILQFLSLDDIPTSKYLKANLVKKPNGEYAMLNFNRRSLLRHQSSIAVLQSAGVLSSNHSDSRITELLSSTAAPEDDNEEENRSRGNGRGSGYDPFKIISRAQSSATGAGTTTELPIDPLVTSMLVSVPSRTPSSSSIISGVTAVTDPNPSTEESNTVPLNFSSTANASAKDKDTKKPSLISNFAIFGSSSNSNPVAAEADENQDHCGELGSLYGGGGGGGGDDRPVRKPFFSNPKASSSSSPQNSNAIAHRLTFSHENPISVATASASAESSAAGGGGAGAGGQRLSHGKSSFTKSSSQDSSSSSSASINATSAAGASVGAENASRFMRRRSVTNLLEGRPSGITSPPIEGQGQAPMSPTTATAMTEESDDVSVVSTTSAVSSVLESRPSAVRDKLRRRGSASAALAQQTAQFRKKVSDQSQAPATGGSTSIAEE